VSAEPILELPEREDAGPPRWQDDPETLADVAAFLDSPRLEEIAATNGRARSSIRIEDWPTPPDADAFHGLAGDVVRTIEPHSEADPVALLTHTLVVFGSIAGRRPHIQVEADEHPCRHFVAIVGDSSRGRKDTSFGQTRRLFTAVDESFPERIEGGLSSGEGLIDRVRDLNAEDENEDGPRDKRVLIMESELAGPLKVIERQGNTLSPVVRAAWDGTTLSTLTRNNRARATDTHISLIGHITIEELRRRLDATEAANGFGNRFLWVVVRRSKLLPEGGTPPQHELNQLAGRLRRALDHSRSLGQVNRDDNARRLWHEVYPSLTTGHGGLAGTLTSRAEAQVTRLSLTYALLDEADAIGEQHLRAALALWDYSLRSVLHIFGDSTGNPHADTILRALRANPQGLTRTEIRDLFGRHLTAARLDQALAELLEQQRAHFTKETTGGRPIERWHYGAAK
jgi:hypothetical protein